MKKLMIGFVGVCAFAACAEVSSSNTVGYHNMESKAQNNFVAVPFNAVGYNTADIQQIKIVGDGVGDGAETFDIWEGVPTIVDGASFVYWSADMDPEEKATEPYWGDGDCNVVAFSIAPGQGVVLGLSEGLQIANSGEVPADKVEFISIDGNNFVGNTFASEIDIQDIIVEGDSVGDGAETFDIWEGVPTIVEGASFVYWSADMDPEEKATTPYWGDGDCNLVTFPIAPGQGFVLNLSEGLRVSFSAPY